MALQNSKPAKKTTLSCSDFIEYWDIVIEQWLQNRSGCHELKEQALFALDLGFDVDSVSNRLPEPYWGDPDNCSFVIMNYNPGPCNDSRHNYRFCADTDNCMIHEVKSKKYSGFAKSFPLLRNLEPTELWFEDSIGRAWWQKQNDKWIKNLLNELYYERNEFLKLPFAMEFSAWHSSNWKGLSVKDRNKYQSLIDGMVFHPFKDAIKKSDFKFGLCFGSGFGNILENYEEFNVIEYFTESKDEKYGISIYSFEKEFYILNFWNKKNHRNRYPDNASDIIKIIHELPIKSMLSRD